MLKLRGLDEACLYEFTDADDHSVFTCSGRELMNSGLRLEINEFRAARLFFYRRIG